MKFNHNNLVTSFVHAFRGLAIALRRERNFRVHLIFAVIAVAFGLWFGLAPVEWLFVVLAIAFVLVLELANTVFERVIDLVKPRMHPVLHDVKDMMAGAVLVAALSALAVGWVVFEPKIWALFTMRVY